MRKIMIRLFSLLWACMTLGLATPAPEEITKQDWSFNGIAGEFKRDELQRGFQVFKEVCSACHALKHIRYRDLKALGFSEAQVTALAAQVKIKDQLDDAGELVERAGRPSDNIPAPYPNEKAARAANNGAAPADLSLVTKARHNGPDYVYAFLTGFRDAPAGVKLGQGMSYNTVFPGNQISMAPPLTEGQVTYADGTKATIEQMARDVTVFLTWAAEPDLEDRKRTGIKVLIYLIIMTGVFYAAMRRIWADVKH